ncbi:MAG: class I SAM-dependent methyltransferase, partial [Syntrophobacteraceae bacterium]
MTFKDHFTRTAADYSKYRPHYPEDLFSFLASVCPGRKTVWDCATGSGQAAIGVSRFFDRVIATDASEEQIRNARPRKGVTYCVTLAEQAALKKGTIDLAMAGQAAHWFELDSFYSELRRVLGRGGIIAIWFYSLFRIDPVLDDI